MITDALLAFAHFVSIFFIFGMLTAELVLCRGALDLEQVRRLARIDAGYGLSAVAVLVTGVSRLLWGVKGAAFYLSNPVFHLKVGLFILVGLMSILPTVRFLRWRRQLAAAPGSIAAEEVKRMARVVHAELGLLVFIPLFAALMARGIGH